MIKISDLSKVYKIKNDKNVHALNQIDLNLPDRGLVFIIGKSGSGKTTFLNILGGLDTPTSGTIDINGMILDELGGSKYDDYRNYYVGFVFQEYNLIKDYTVGQNIQLALELQNEKDKDVKIANALKEVGLEGYENRKIKQLSGGQKQRVAIARALVKESKIILADEPTGNLDSATSEEIYECFKQIALDRLVIVVSHDVESANRYADRIIKFKDGMIQSDEIRNEITVISQNVELIKEKQKKSGNISYRNIFKMGIRNLWKHKFRLLITAILFITLLSIIGSGITLFEKDPYERYRETYLQAGLNCFSVEACTEDLSKNYEPKAYEELQKFSNVSVLNYYHYEYSISGMEQSTKAHYYSSVVRGFSVMNESVLADCNYDILYGRFPQDGKREICITLYTAQSILKRESEFCKVNSIKSVEDLCNKAITFDNLKGTYAIVGIIDTKIAQIYDSLKRASDAEWEKNSVNPNTLCGKYWADYLPYNIHCNIIVNQYFMDNYYVGFGRYEGQFQQHLRPKDDSYSYATPDAILGTDVIKADLYDMSNIVGEQIVGDNEIVLNKRIFSSYMHEDSITLDLRDDGYYYIDFKLYNDTNNKIVSKNLKIKGYLVDDDAPCIVSNNLFDQIVDKTLMVNSIQFFLLDEKSDKQLFKYVSQDNLLLVYDEIYAQVADVNGSIEAIITIGGYVLIGVVVFTLLMMLNFIVSTINNTKHEMGILRALGTKQSNVFAIYFTEMLILSLIVWFVSIFAVIGITSVCSNELTKSTPFVDAGTVMPMGVLSVLGMLLFSALIAFVGSAIPILTKTKKKPIDLLK